jgi:hypothetical protein
MHSNIITAYSNINILIFYYYTFLFYCYFNIFYFYYFIYYIILLIIHYYILFLTQYTSIITNICVSHSTRNFPNQLNYAKTRSWQHVTMRIAVM